MAKFLSGRKPQFSIGVSSSTENKTVLDVTGKVGIGTTVATASLDVIGGVKVTGVANTALVLSTQESSYSGLLISAPNMGDGVGILRLEGAEPDINLNQIGGSGYNTLNFNSNGSAKLALGRDVNHNFYITRYYNGNWYDNTFTIDYATGTVGIGSNLNVVGITTLASSGGITTTGGDLYVGRNLYIGNDVVLDELNSRNINVSGVGTITTLYGTQIGFTTANFVSGVVTSITGTNLNYTGVGTITNFNSTNSTITYLSSTNINSSGIITATRLSTGASGVGINISNDSITGPSTIFIDPAAVGDNTGIVRIKGDLYVDGTQTFINSTTVEIADLQVGIATTVGTNLLLDGGGIGIGSTNIRKTFVYDYLSDSLKSSENLNIALGKTYKINGTDVLSATTLGSGVTFSSLTSVGTLTQLRVAGISTFVNGPVLIGSGTSTGTANQLLQVTGNAYLSGNLGIGTLTSSIPLTIVGNSFISGVLTAVTLNSTTGIITNLSGVNLNYTGVGTFSGGPVLIGSGTSTGTASQRLQVTGGAYVSTNIGVGITSPRETLDVVGTVGIQSTGSANRFYIQHNTALNSLDFVFV